ncbi:hydantoinase B/oxoprolinase family protein [Streptomyces pimonensis]|uniref:Hydantoinase B/oxoprolinase family protein n=1 Tax=Streptomyces pimonensis TaxID=2860288 RepID=A0ABV4J261_9ACTN
MTVSTLSQHRRGPPYGMAGGEPDVPGTHRIERADGTVTRLAGSDSADVEPGDVLVVETPRRRGTRPAARPPSSRRRDR